MAGDFFQREDKWFCTVNEHGKDIELGPFATREEAGKAYMAKVDELYPPPPPPQIDPEKHHGLIAAGLESEPTKIG